MWVFGKICTKCNIEKPLSEYGIDGRTGKHITWCRSCRKAYGRKYYLDVIKPVEHPEKPKRSVRENHRWCLKCGLEKLQSDYYGNGGNTCKECANKASRLNAKNNFETRSKKSKEWRSKNIDRIKKKAAEHRERTNHSAYSNKKAKEYKKKITDGYVKSRLRSKGMPNKDITPEFIEITRAAIIIERIKRGLQKKGLKICAVCKESKSIKEFTVRKFVWKGVIKPTIVNLCKKCENIRTYQYKKNRNGSTGNSKHDKGGQN